MRDIVNPSAIVHQVEEASEIIKQRVNSRSATIRQKTRNNLDAAYEQGKDLIKLKDRHGRNGTWGKWVKENLKDAYETVNHYMRIAKWWDVIEAEIEKSTDTFFGINDALRLIELLNNPTTLTKPTQVQSVDPVILTNKGQDHSSESNSVVKLPRSARLFNRVVCDLEKACKKVKDWKAVEEQIIKVKELVDQIEKLRSSESE